MLSDFGTSRDMLSPDKSRSGHTGTLEYTAPEMLPSPSTGLLRQPDSKADMWSLGMILHKMLFFKLPYVLNQGDSVPENAKLEELETEILLYRGFSAYLSFVSYN